MASKKTAVSKTVKKRRNRSPDCPQHPGWSTSTFWAFIRAGLRSKWTRWPPRFEVLKNAKRRYTGPKKLQKYEYECAICHCCFPQKDVEVDHIEPVGSLKDYDDLPTFVRRLFVAIDKLRVVCKPCHKAITRAAAEARERKEMEDARTKHEAEG